MQIAGYRINMDALLARLIYPWRYRALAAAFALLLLSGLGSGLIPPFWQGRTELTITAAPGASVLVDGRPWPRPIYAGAHQILATLPDGRRSWADVTLHASAALTLTLPAGLPTPRERTIPPAAPGMHVDQVWWADGAWRVRSVRDLPSEPPDSQRTNAEPTPLPQIGQTIAISAQNVERLGTLDAYAGLADQVHVGSQLHEALYRPNTHSSYGDQSLGAITVRGWANTLSTFPISLPLALVRFAPAGDSLLWAETIANGGEQVYLARPGTDRMPVVAVPGHITRLSWRPDSSAVVLHSIAGDRLTLTLVRLKPSIIAAVIADLPATSYAGALVPLTWGDLGLLWVAPDTAGVPSLWHAPLTSLIPERQKPIDARALTQLSDGTLRVLQIQGDSVVIGRYQGALFIGEAIVPGVPASPDLAGIWQGTDILLQAGDQAWLLSLDVKE
jgi:hypothetical protein